MAGAGSRGALPHINTAGAVLMFPGIFNPFGMTRGFLLLACAVAKALLCKSRVPC